MNDGLIFVAPTKGIRFPLMVMALALACLSSRAQAMPDDMWCTSVSAMRFDQPDSLGQVARAVAQHRWDLPSGLFSREFPVPASLEGRDRALALRAFHSIQLISASARGDLREVDRLLAVGADPNVEGDLDYIATPLAMAALCDRPAVARRLIRAGARVNYRFSYANSQAVREGTTALMWAGMGGSLSVVRLLLARGARRACPANRANITATRALRAYLMSLHR
jgi:hypothetical protein